MKWIRCPKDIYVDLTVLKIGTASAVSKFDAGMVRVLRVLVKLVIVTGSNSIDYCNKRDKLQSCTKHLR